MAFDYDYVIVGSGFGGSVSALRLAEKGYKVCVIEKGKRFADSDFPKTNWNLRRYLWMPSLRCFGIQNLSLFRHLLILSGVGVGGGSLVYANTLLEPPEEFYEAPSWKELANWKTELRQPFETAKAMLGVTLNPRLTDADHHLKECARDLGRENTFKRAEVGVYFGEPGKTVPDPYFRGEGPARAGCTFCGGCMVGCRHNAKNTLTKNYLFFAEKHGVTLLVEQEVQDIKPVPGGYDISHSSSTRWFNRRRATLRAQNVILAGGVLGTLALLLKCKHTTQSLPLLSDRLGQDVRTNNEALVGVSELASGTLTPTEGIAITSVFHADSHTRIEPVRYSKGSSLMRLLAAPMIEGGETRIEILRRFFRNLFKRHWAESSIILLVMQTVDSRIRFQLGRSPFTFFRRRMITSPEKGRLKVPSILPIANQVCRAFARKANGVPLTALNEALLNIPTTAHVLGGCGIGLTSEEGVVDSNHEVFGYPGLYVCDGSVIPANLGVNPSLTIVALTERAMSRIPSKSLAL